MSVACLVGQGEDDVRPDGIEDVSRSMNAWPTGDGAASLIVEA